MNINSPFSASYDMCEGHKELGMVWQQVLALCNDDGELFKQWFPQGSPLLKPYSQSEFMYPYESYAVVVKLHSEDRFDSECSTIEYPYISSAEKNLGAGMSDGLERLERLTALQGYDFESRSQLKHIYGEDVSRLMPCYMFVSPGTLISCTDLFPCIAEVYFEMVGVECL